jgi:hypothetical protein
MKDKASSSTINGKELVALLDWFVLHPVSLGRAALELLHLLIN